MGLGGAAQAGVDVAWTPMRGLMIDARGEIFVSPSSASPLEGFVIDRETDSYDERIIDSQGDVVREVHERLRDHQGRGDAKRRKPRKDARSDLANSNIAATLLVDEHTHGVQAGVAHAAVCAPLSADRFDQSHEIVTKVPIAAMSCCLMLRANGVGGRREEAAMTTQCRQRQRVVRRVPLRSLKQPPKILLFYQPVVGAFRRSSH